MAPVVVDADSESSAIDDPLALSELDRLSFVIQQIDDDCALMPFGALVLTAAKQIVENVEFRGTL